MKSLFFFKTATFFLLLLNLGLLFFLFQRGPRKQNLKVKFHQEAVEILGLDASQQADFDDLIKEHSSAIIALNAENSAILAPYFYEIFSNNNLSKRDSLMLRFQAIEKEKVEITRDHFWEVRKILKPEQEKNMDLFLKKAINILLLDKKHPPKPHQ